MKNTRKHLFLDKYSKKHHYLPVFYLKGFADPSGNLQVYDKIKDEFLSNQNPESKFYVNHLNNYKFNGHVKFTLEESIMNNFDDEGCRLFEKVRTSKFNITDPLSSLEKFRLIGYLQKLYWRHPSTSTLFVDLIKKEGLSNKYFAIGLKDSEKQLSDEEIPEIKHGIVESEELQKVHKMVVPLQNSAMEEAWHIFDKFKIFGIESDKFTLITGDFPYLIKNDNVSMDNVFGELIFPLSKYRLLCCANNSPNFLDSILIMRVNLTILHLSKRFIACDKKESLEKVVSIYKNFINKGFSNSLLNDTFDLVNIQSKFSDYESYKQHTESKFKMTRN